MEIQHYNNHIVLLRRCIISIIIFTGIFLVYLVFYYGNGLKREDAVEITEWRYTTGGEVPSLDESDIGWINTMGSESVAKPFGDRYIRLQHTFTDPEASKTLYLRTGNHPVRIYIDGKICYDTMGANTLYTGSRVTKLPLTASGDSCVLDIVLYSAAYLDIRAFLVPSAEEGAVWGIFAYTDIFLAVVLFLFAVFWVGCMLFCRKEKGGVRPIFCLAGLPCWLDFQCL